MKTAHLDSACGGMPRNRKAAHGFGSTELINAPHVLHKASRKASRFHCSVSLNTLSCVMFCRVSTNQLKSGLGKAVGWMGSAGNLGDVVGDVVDYMHVQVVSLPLKDLLEGLPHQECHGRAVDPCIVRRACHTGQVVLPFLSTCTAAAVSKVCIASLAANGL